LASDRRAYARDIGVVLLSFAVAGALGALVWHWWWTPAPTGFVFEGDAYFGPDLEFRSTGTYVVVSAALGLLLGVVLTYLLDRDEVVTLVALVVGGLLGAAVLALVGHLLGPESAAEVARGAADGDAVKADLRVQPGAAYLIFPVASLVGSLVVLLTFPSRD
jgi:hypothetical protein